MQILPSTTDNESGITVEGVKVFRSADWTKAIFINLTNSVKCSGLSRGVGYDLSFLSDRYNLCRARFNKSRYNHKSCQRGINTG